MINSKKIDNFIKNFRKIYLQNPNLPVTSDTFYSSLMNYGLDENEKNINIDDELNIIKNYFKNSKNIDSYVDIWQPFFLQMRNCTINYSKTIKIYLSFPKNYIATAAKKIFNYIDKNNIQTFSKISNQLRADSLIIRLRTPEDAQMVMNYINNDRELNEYAKETNPFCFKNGNMGVAYDDNLSYNRIVCDILSYYFYNLKKNNLLNTANYQNFKDYVNNYYKNIFKNLSEFDNLTGSLSFLRVKDNYKTVGECINNFEQVTRLFLLFINNELTLDDYFMFYNGCLDVKKNQSISSYYDDVYHNYNKKKNCEDNLSIDCVQILNEYIKFAVEKYGINNIASYLKEYVLGNKQAITRTNNLRDRFIKYLSPDKIIEITNGNLNNYINNILNEKKSSNNCVQILDEYIIFACNKYGKNNIVKYLKAYISGSDTAITRTNDFRNKFKEYLTPKMIIEITNGDLDNYINNVINKKYDNSQNNYNKTK